MPTNYTNEQIQAQRAKEEVEINAIQEAIASAKAYFEAYAQIPDPEPTTEKEKIDKQNKEIIKGRIKNGWHHLKNMERASKK